ncbi:UDP-N-acetylmuramoyl-L-alanine--D-glutamate ligase [Heyndrickxia acidiproducens]|uniref:UDP-N-acetylmuramoyl-L-alanine--D-glutamate ligase n=1 Tax=Heyndrickxia acidiproducens TaxID=1121084 RepID=UPI00036DE617|nr:UDP-N-acetylmuramoyl-L-alanine--D-glutamate ligase [Heyndrickxia acidiproducens]
MKLVNEYQHKKVLVLGLAKSGVSAASLLHKLGAFVTVNDYKPLEENTQAQGLLEQGIKVICGSHPIELLDEGFELIVKNPGIPYTNPLVAGAIAKGIPIITEIELAYKIAESEIVGITGTNGKTTTTTLIYKIFEADRNLDPLIAGNIGTVASEVAQKARPDQQMIVELSSFQLMGVETFRPHIAIITNIYEAHLDYHGTKQAYAKAKSNITRNQLESDYLILNHTQPELWDLVSFTKAKIIPFSTKEYLQDGCSVKDGVITWKGEKIISRSEIMLPGDHNLENILAAVAASKLMGAGNEAIREVLTTFKGVKHRTQYIGEINGRKFYNDSKATNILACESALKAFHQPVILLAGGLDRGNGFDELIPSLKYVKALITFGETAPKLESTAKKAGIETIKRVENVEKAVLPAYELSEPGDVVLLSPACASWDQYKSFEIRGDIFIDAVHKLR